MADVVEGPVLVRVPASSANLGPGFDSLGLALTLYDEVRAAVLDGPGTPEISVEGEGAAEVPRDASHLVHRAMVRGFAAMGLDAPGIRLRCTNAIPHGRGLGSSSAAIVAGLAAARALTVGGEEMLDDDRLFEFAAELEGHPDNVAPAVYGGLTISYAMQGAFRAARLEVVPEVAFVAFVPAQPLATAVARGLLPDSVPHRDAAANAGRAALVVAALTGRPELLLAATEDRLHQHYRAPAMPASAALVAELRAQGLAAVVSGAGPTVLVIVRRDEVGLATGHAPDGWRVVELDVDLSGVRATRE